MTKEKPMTTPNPDTGAEPATAAGDAVEDLAEAAAAMAAGMRAFGERQAAAYDPMGGAVPRPAGSIQQPFLPPDPGDGIGGVT
jgi:hypothetical protein